MTSSEPTGPRIERASQSEVAEALGLIFAHLSVEDQAQRVEATLAEFRSGRTPLEGLWVARRQGRLVGAILAQVQVGKTAVLWPPRLLAEEPQATAQQLLAATCEWLAQQPVRVAHALLEREDPEDLALLQASGFQPLAMLLYLVSQEPVFPHNPPETDLEFEVYAETNDQRLAEVVEATYEGTLDCPGLDNVRPVEEVLEGYRATGLFSPSRWFILRHQGQDVGCLLLTDYPEADSWELIYMGIVPTARGKGWGVQITKHAQWLTRCAGRARLVLAVDEANAPAVRMYNAAGFEAWDRRIVLQKVFG